MMLQQSTHLRSSDSHSWFALWELTNTNTNKTVRVHVSLQQLHSQVPAALQYISFGTSPAHQCQVRALLLMSDSASLVGHAQRRHGVSSHRPCVSQCKSSAVEIVVLLPCVVEFMQHAISS